MLEELLGALNNRFAAKRLRGSFEVSGGRLDVPGALDGQHAWIEGSVFNDGLHECPLEGLKDERFEGTVELLAVPPAVERLAADIEAWEEENAAALGPYQSESTDGYSYSVKASAAGGAYGWRERFAAEMRRWRRI